VGFRLIFGALGVEGEIVANGRRGDWNWRFATISMSSAGERIRGRIVLSDLKVSGYGIFANLGNLGKGGRFATGFIWL